MPHDQEAIVASVGVLEHALLSLDRVTVNHIFLEFHTDLTPIARVEQLIVPVLEHIGTGWEEGRVSLAQVYMSGRLCEEIVDTFLPPTDSARTDMPPMAIAVLEDYHFLGLRLVYSSLRASGFALRNYGHCDLEELVKHVIDDGIRILLISTLMLPSALRVKELRRRLRELNHPVTLIVGGAPFRFDATLWQEVEADAMGANAAEAASLLTRLIEEGV